MKKTLLILLGFGCMFTSSLVKAQSFTVAADTVHYNIGGTGVIYDDITNAAGSALTLRWRVIATDWPASWLSNLAFGICDNNLCRNNFNDTLLWNNATSLGNTFTTAPYAVGSTGTFDLNLDFTTAVVGCHWMTIAITDPGTFYTKNITFSICKGTTAIQNINSTGETNVLLYPNPASNEINVVYDASADVKNIAVYNIIGKVITVYRVTGNSANLNLENTPSGIYFVKLLSSTGQVVATRKFTKQ